jgi:hypothetical protein
MDEGSRRFGLLQLGQARGLSLLAFGASVAGAEVGGAAGVIALPCAISTAIGSVVFVT